jgi:broad specificity phosphatase PhoE
MKTFSMFQRAILFITHADVTIDSAVPIQDWPLSPRGRARHERFAQNEALKNLTAIYTSPERKARDAAALLPPAPITILEALKENDRSATGYLPQAEFEKTADDFFANPDTSIRGWERAIDAQSRIIKAINHITSTDPTEGDIAISAHGGVGALLLAHLKKSPISRRHDQPPNKGGNFFRFQGETLLHGWQDIAPPTWRPMRPEDLEAVESLGNQIHTAHPERPEIFAERLAVSPQTCFVLESVTLDGYLIAHPWSGPPPPLDTLIQALPNTPDHLYLHDLALAPHARRQGHAQTILAQLPKTPAALIAVGNSAPFWQSQGFRPAPIAPEKRASYGPTAAYMRRPA